MLIPQEELDKLQDKVFDEEIKGQEQEDEGSSSPAKDDVADEARVPYSRFETVNERAIRAEEELRILKEQKAQDQSNQSDVSLPDNWIELYGDNEDSKKAYLLQMQEDEKRADAIFQKVQAKQLEEQRLKSETLQAVEQGLQSLSQTLKRKLTEAEENSILDIQDEFTPKDQNGNYVTPLLDPNKAWEVYTLRQQTAKNNQIASRRKVTSLTGAGAESEATSTSFESYNARNWGQWRDKI